jgi:hypothetical protein
MTPVTIPKKGGLPPPNKLAIPSLILASIAASMTPLALNPSNALFYMLAVLPLGFGSALLARISLNQIRRGAGTKLDRNIAVIAYFLGFLPGLFLCGMLTVQLFGMTGR